jgi:hypothetical protein
VLPAYFRGDLGYNRATYFGGLPIVGDSTAFNLGKLIGLPPAFQLWPLAAIWMLAAWRLICVLGRFAGKASPGRRRIFALSGYVAIAALFLPPTIGSLMPVSGATDKHGLLGRYYEGLGPNGFPPHLVRIDRQLDFGSIADLGALPYPSYTVWTGEISIPRNGLYTFRQIVDDVGWLIIDGHPVIPDSGQEPRYTAYGQAVLTAGIHRIEVGERNLVGDSSLKMFWQPPGGAEEMLPSEVLIPNRPG